MWAGAWTTSVSTQSGTTKLFNKRLRKTNLSQSLMTLRDAICSKSPTSHPKHYEIYILSLASVVEDTVRRELPNKFYQMIDE